MFSFEFLKELCFYSRPILFGAIKVGTSGGKSSEVFAINALNCRSFVFAFRATCER